MIKLIITADDGGLSEGINQSAALLHEQGLVSAVSIMPNYQAVPHSVTVLAAYPNLELGIHLTLTEGIPLTRAAQRPELTRDSGVFRNQFFLYPQVLFPSDDLLAAIRSELKAQMDQFLSFGQQPKHITTHHHFHIFPALRDVVYQLAHDYDVAWVRNSDYRASIVPFNPVIDKSCQIEATHTFVVPDFIILVKSWLDLRPQMLVAELLTLHGIVELVVHPSLAEDPTYPRDVRYTPKERHQEMLYLQKLGALLQPHLGQEIHISNFLEAHRA